MQTAQHGARAVASTARSVSKRVVQGVEAAAVRTFNVGLKAANLSPERFWNVLDNLGDVVKPLINDGKRLVTNFLKGVGQGFEGFFKNIGKHILGGLTEWLLNERITDFSNDQWCNDQWCQPSLVGGLGFYPIEGAFLGISFCVIDIGGEFGILGACLLPRFAAKGNWHGAIESGGSV